MISFGRQAEKGGKRWRGVQDYAEVLGLGFWKRACVRGQPGRSVGWEGKGGGVYARGPDKQGHGSEELRAQGLTEPQERGECTCRALVPKPQASPLPAPPSALRLQEPAELSVSSPDTAERL